MDKPSISRGHEREDAPENVHRLSIVARGDPPPPVPAPTPCLSPLYQPVHDRLAALERLAHLHERGALSDEEYAAEKAVILERHPDELVLNEPLIGAEAPAPGPPLLGGWLSWKFIPVGLAAGLALSFASQPRETMRFFSDLFSLFGA